MSGKYVLAIDAGSGGCRVLVADVQGIHVSSSHQQWSYDTPDEVAPLGKEFDAPAFWGVISQLIAEAIRKSAMTPSDIVAVSAASQRQGVVFLDRGGRELYAGPNTDLRALSEGLAIDAEFGSQICRITGHAPSFLFTPAKLRWFQLHRPEVYERTATVLSVSNWIVYRLSGERVGEASSDCDTGLVDVCQARWSGSLMDMLHVPPEICPRMATAGTQVGQVTRAAAEQTGLDAGTPVVVGGADTQCGLLGMGVVAEGQVGIVAGWSGTLQMATARPIMDPAGRIWTGCHVVPGKWILESNAQESGGAYEWLGRLICDTSDTSEDTYALMDQLAQEVAPGAEGVLAFIGPSQMDMSRLTPRLGGFIFPITPSVTNIDRKHLVRAALENLCFAFKANLAQLEEVSQLTPTEVCIGGGLAQSHSLVQILSDSLGMPVTSFEVAQVTPSGIAMCAAVGAGVYPDLEQAAQAMRPKSIVVEPDPESSQIYARSYSRWLQTARWLENLRQEMG